MQLLHSSLPIIPAYILAALLPFASVNAAEITVNSTADPAGFNPNILVEQLGGTVTLRDAVNALGNSVGSSVNPGTIGIGPHTITFAPELAGQTIELTQMGNLPSGSGLYQGPTAIDFSVAHHGLHPNIPTQIIIQGPTGDNGVTISRGGTNEMRLFNVHSRYSQGRLEVTFNNLTLRDGSLNGEGYFVGAGGAMRVGANTRVNVNRCTLLNNSATGLGNTDGNGGAIYVNNGEFYANHCTFTGNHAGHSGGAAYQYGDGNFLLSNCTITGNSARYWGALMAHVDSTKPQMVNCIVAYNTGTQFHADTSTNPVTFYNQNEIGTPLSYAYNNLVRAGPLEGRGGMVNGTFGNIVGNVNPMLGPFDHHGGPTKTFNLLVGSPAIDTGTHFSAATTDQRGYPRPYNGQFDMGAVEYNVTPPVFTSADNVIIPPYGSTEFRITADAIDGEVTFSATGTFPAGISLTADGRLLGNAFDLGLFNIVITASSGVLPDTVQNFTINVFEEPSLVVTTHGDTVLQDGNTSLREALIHAATLAGPQTITFAPGMAGTTIRLNKSWANTADLNALRVTGDVTIQGPSTGPGIIIETLVDANPAVPKRRHFLVEGSGSLTLENLTLINGNGQYGGAVWNLGNLTVRGCTFIDNHATSEGGAIQSWGDSPSLLVENSTFSNNTSDGHSSAINAGSVSMALRHLTITGGTATNGAGTITIWKNQATLVNCIVAGNSDDGLGFHNGGTLSAQSTNNIIGIGTGGSGGLLDGVNGNQLGASLTSLKLSPLADNGGPTHTVGLLAGSAALDAGAVLAGIAMDQRGVSRSDGSPDIGAFERIQVPEFTLLSPNDLEVANGEAASELNGTFFAGSIIGRDPVIRTFTIANTDGAVLAISNIETTGTNPGSFSIVGAPATVVYGEMSTFELRFHPQSTGDLSAAFVFTHNGPDSPFTFEVRGVGKLFEASQASGPAAGGNTVTFTFGSFGTITNVLVGGVAAQIVENHGDAVSIIMPPGTSIGLVDITIQTLDTGDLTLPDAYTYNPQGRIGLRQPSVMGMGIRDRRILKKDGTVFQWGYPGILETLQSPGAQYVAVASGSRNEFYDNSRHFLRADGIVETLYFFGTTTSTEPYGAEPYKDIVAIAAGNNHTLGLRSDGSIVGWGRNTEGQTTVPAPNADFVWIAAGGSSVTPSGPGPAGGHSLGVKADGSIVGWGENGHGQTTVPAPNSDFVAVAAGQRFSLGLKSDGSVVGWGDNAFGQTDVPAPNTGFVAISAGRNHSLGLKADGSIVAWGRDVEGQTIVPSPNTDFVAITAAIDASWGLQSDGTLVGWGSLEYYTLLPPSPENHKDIAMPGGVTSPKGSWTGGYEVVIAGTNLSSGEMGDIESVTLAGIPATVQSVSGGSHIVVLAGAAPNADLLGDVVVTSTSHGVTTKADAFTYLTDFSLPAWRTLHVLAPDGSQDLANPSGDGVANLLKYAFNMAPNAGNLTQSNLTILDPIAGTAGLPAIRPDDPGRLVITFIRHKAATNPGILYEVLTGEDLADLQPLDISGAVVESIDFAWERVTATDPATTEKRFGQVRVAVGP